MPNTGKENAMKWECFKEVTALKLSKFFLKETLY